MSLINRLKKARGICLVSLVVELGGCDFMPRGLQPDFYRSWQENVERRQTEKETVTIHTKNGPIVLKKGNYVQYDGELRQIYDIKEGYVGLTYKTGYKRVPIHDLFKD